MPITAEFQADFSKFADAVDGAQTKLVTFEDNSKKVANTLSAMERSISGIPIVQAATVAAEAVERLGGVSKLTEDELTRLGGTAQQAVEKLRALGKDVPEGIQKIADAAHTAEGATEELSASGELATGVMERLMEVFAVERILEFAKGAIESAARLDDLHMATGVSIEGLQKLEYVGKEFGIGLDEMSRGVEQLSAKLATGDRSAVGAVQALGLNVQALLAAGPEEAFLQIAEAVGRIDDPMQKAGIASELFGGKLSKQLLPALEDLRSKMAEVPPLMSDATVKMAQDFDVGLERMELRAKAFAAGLANAWFGQGGVIDTLKGTKYVAVEAGDSFGVLADGAEKGGKALAGLHEGMGVVLTGAQLLQNRLSALRSEAIVPLTQTQKDAVLELESYGEAQANIAKLLQVSEAAVHRFTEEQKAHTEAVKAAALDEAKAQQIAADAEEMLHRQFLKNWKEEETEKKRQTDTINKQVVTGFDEIQAAQAKLHDATMKDTLDSASYQINKIYETADAQVKAFKGTETQRKQYSDAVMNLADIEASHVMYAADTAMDDVAKKATDHIDDVSKKASNAMQSLQGGVKLPGSSETQAFGQTYLNSPTGARVPLGPHGELPKNWDALYSGQATIPQFAGGVQNFGGGLAVVGERGPELVTLPRGSDVLPYGRGVGGGVVQQIAIYVNGTAVDVAKQVADVLMRSAMQGQQFGGA